MNEGERIAPDELGNYLLGAVIGRGSMAVIHQSVDPHTGAKLALKTLRPDVSDAVEAADFRARLALEAAACSRLHHPGIVGFVAHGDAQGRPYLALEYVEGRSLHEHLERGGVFSIPRAVDLLRQLLEALQYAHQQGVWHRDVKPSNLLVTDEGRLTLIDFGIAHQTPQDVASDTPAMILGTPGYIAPEMYLSEAFDSRVDLFACGAILYELLSGRPAFSGTADAIMFAVRSATRTAPSVAGNSPSLAVFDATVLKALAQDPERRFADAATFRKALLQAYGEFAEAQARDHTMP